MRKKVKLFILIITLILILYVHISYAIEGSLELNVNSNLNTNIQEQSKIEFFSVDSKEKEIGSTLNMYINLSEINYDISKFTLNSSIILENIDAELVEEGSEIDIEKENNEFYLIINKNELNIEQIVLTYTVSNNFKVGDKFILTGKIIEYKEENIEENIEDDNQLNKESNIEETQIEITIVEKQENEKDVEELKVNQDNEINTTEASEQVQKQVQNSMQTIVKNSTSNYSSTQTVVYNGSRNNYLESISVTDYELNTQFSKENTTYFLVVPNEVTSIKIATTKEESSSTVCIYGNDNLEVGTNKILISVTAENGDVRNYRIFVTRES